MIRKGRFNKAQQKRAALLRIRLVRLVALSVLKSQGLSLTPERSRARES